MVGVEIRHWRVGSQLYMLTINAASHSLMQNFHKPADEKRIVVILSPKRYQDWLLAKPEVSEVYMFVSGCKGARIRFI